MADSISDFARRVMELLSRDKETPSAGYEPVPMPMPREVVKEPKRALEVTRSKSDPIQYVEADGKVYSSAGDDGLRSAKKPEVVSGPVGLAGTSHPKTTGDQMSGPGGYSRAVPKAIEVVKATNSTPNISILDYDRKDVGSSPLATKAGQRFAEAGKAVDRALVPTTNPIASWMFEHLGKPAERAMKATPVLGNAMRDYELKALQAQIDDTKEALGNEYEADEEEKRVNERSPKDFRREK